MSPPQSRLGTPRHVAVLLAACLVMFSNYYCYDIPAAINVPLRTWLGSSYDEYQWQINLLYTVYSLPNIILPLIGGLLVDNLSATTMLLVFITFVSAGQTIFAAGISAKSFPVMVVGRIIFGAGGESLEVATSRITTEWFKGRGLGFAMSLHLSMARIAAASNDNFSPWLTERFSTPFAGWFGLFVCGCSYACAIAMIYLDRPASRAIAGVASEYARPNTKKRSYQGASDPREHQPLLAGSVPDFQLDVGTPPSVAPQLAYDSMATIDVPSTALSSANSAASLLIKNGETSTTASDDKDGYDEEDEHVHFSQLRGLSWSFWVLCLVTIGLYGSSVPFFHICTDMFQQKWYEGDMQKAGMVMSIPDIVSAIGSPLCGLFIDRYGHRATLLPFAGILIITTHALLGWTMLSPIIAMTILGLAYSIFASALWTCVPYLVGPHQIATAYGLVAVALNVSLALFPLAVARIRSAAPETFVPVEAFFIFLGLVSILLSTILCIVDERSGAVLRHVSFPTTDGEVTPPGELEDDGSPFRHHGGGRQSPTYDSEDEHTTVRVIGDGVIVPSARTHIHHNHSRHHAAGEHCTCAAAPHSMSRMGSSPPSRIDAWGGGGSLPTYTRVGGGRASPSRSPTRRERRGGDEAEEVSPTRTPVSARASEELHHRGLRTPRPADSPPPPVVRNQRKTPKMHDAPQGRSEGNK
ncbi:hypothetical protein HDU88_003415 [Geranomyces variabilis]|nr:hypothetical protein HDU88_003415 [Geranomyces variabilis]